MVILWGNVMVTRSYHSTMEGVTVTIPPWMVSEVDDRIVRSGRRSRYIREAVQHRIEAENAGEWETPAVENPNAVATDGGGE